MCGPLTTLVGLGVARVEGEVVDLHLNGEEASEGGMVSISMRVPVRHGERVVEELFSAWLAVPPGVADGTMLRPSALLRGMVRAPEFRARVPVPVPVSTPS
ncbi:MAG TPA: hypothetical protein VMZ28_22020 [Kofleriaceae bacterium]|nr:hypothetical protein [Kofleriaceae bacterium]